jgi:periplasmic divalent cation tolerance protein
MNPEPAILITSVSNANDATKLAGQLIELSLAACVTRLPQGISHFKWEGKVCVENEEILLIKTDRTKITEIKNLFKNCHPYTTPELIAINGTIENEEYLHWFKNSLLP